MSKWEKGSILIIALFVAGLLGFVVGSYLQLTLLQLEMANRKFYERSAINLAEAGAETAVLALNQQDWTGWSISGVDALRVLDPIDVGNNMIGNVTVKIVDTVFNPVIFSEATIDLISGEQLREQIKVVLTPRSFFGNGITATNYVRFEKASGSLDTYANIDSYDSTLGDYDIFLNRNDNGSVACEKMYSEEKNENHGMIYVYVATDPVDFPPEVGDNGKIYGVNTLPGVNVDSTRISADFKAAFPDITPITGTTAYVLPGDNLVELGAGTTLEKYKITGDLHIQENQTLRINGNVAIVVTDDVVIDGLLEVTEPNGRLVIYVKDDINIKQNKPGLDNKSKDPEKVIIYSTAMSNDVGALPSYTLEGNSDIYAAFYAPRMNVTLRKRSSGKFFGALVGRRVTFEGDYDFHYDENLKNYAGDLPTYMVGDYQVLKPFEMVTLTL